MRFTLDDIKRLKEQRLIRDYVDVDDPTVDESGKRKTKKSVPHKKAEGLVFIEWQVFAWCKERSYVMRQEYRFTKGTQYAKRKWRFDVAVVEEKLAFEYEGIFGKGKSRHTTKKGYQGDAQKYTAANVLGWRLFRYTGSDFQKVGEDLRLYESNHKNVH